MTANVGYATLQIVPSAAGFTSALEGQIAMPMRTASAKAGKASGAGFSSAFMKSLGPLAAAFGAGIALKAVWSVTMKASDLNETYTKVQQIFGANGTKLLDDFSSKAALAMGMTKQEALDAAATFGVFGKAAGLSGKALDKFSMANTTLASDLASFYNTSPEDAALAMQAALRGEYEPIRKYGVLVNQASIQQEAYRMGLIKTTKEALTPQARTLATNAVIMRQTADAHGDFTRTGWGLANMLRKLHGLWGNMQVAIGNLFLPVAKKAVKFIVDTMSPALKWIEGFSNGFSTKKLGSGLSSIFSGWAEDIKPNIERVVNGLKGFIDYISKTFGPSFRIIKDAIFRYVIPAFVYLRDAYYQKIYPLWLDIIGVIAHNLKPMFDKLGRFFKETLAPAFAAFAKKVRDVLPYVVAYFQRVAEAAKPVWSWLSKIVGFLGSAAIDQAKATWNGLGVVFKVLASQVKGFYSVAKSALGAFAWLWNETVGRLGLGPKIDLSTIDWAGTGKVKQNAAVDAAKAQVKGVADYYNQLAAKGKAALAAQTAKNSKPTPTPTPTPTDTTAKADPLASIKALLNGSFAHDTATQNKKGALATLAKVENALRHLKTTAREHALAIVKHYEKILAPKFAAKDKIEAQLAKAQAALDSIKQKQLDARNGARDSALALGDITSAAGIGGVDSMLATLKASVQTTSDFNAALTTLKGMGLSQDILDKLLAAGPQAGLATAQAILAAGQGGIDQLNELQKQLNSAAGALGSTASSLYDAGVTAATALVNGLKSQDAAITAQIQNWLAQMENAVNASLGIADRYKDIPVPKVVSSTVPTPNGPSAPGGGRRAPDALVGDVVNITVNNPVSEPTSVTTSKALSRLAMLKKG